MEGISILCYNTFMQNVVIIGAGFAGTAVMRALARHHRDIQVTLIDKSDRMHFLPLLPDVIGRELPWQCLTEDIRRICTRTGTRFCQEEVVRIDPEKRVVLTGKGSHAYDYLVIASGSQTNFYGNLQAQRRAFCLDNADDAMRLAQAVRKGAFDTVVIAGAGYTGVEIASNVAVYFKKHNLDRRIIVVERQQSILGPLPEWMKAYCVAHLQKLGVEIHTATMIEEIRENEIVLSGNRLLARPLLVWAAGVRTADFIQHYPAEKNTQGRLKVGAQLRLDERIFCVGDASLFTHGNAALRMAVQYALFEGTVAAENIMRCIRNRPLREYRPLDLGYIIPLANNKGCGVIFGVPVRGVCAVFLHYCMCLFRLEGFRNKWCVLRALVMPQRKGTELCAR